MAHEAVQNYVNLVSGLTRTTRTKAAAGAKALLASAGLDDVAADAGGRVSKLADEIVSASKANRELMRHLIAT
ncbi:MAG: polyhydroxyalkanoate synthesis protein PhaF, partial [Actinomycetes bacterium]